MLPLLGLCCFLEAAVNLAFLISPGDAHFHKSHLDTGFPFGTGKGIRDKFNLCPILVHLLYKLLPGVAERVPDGLRIEQADDTAAVLLHIQSFQQMLVPF